MSTSLGQAEIARLIPHGGPMCLLDRVVRWDATSITCRASGHRDPSNPLARDGRLEAICGVEYAAQAMAVHGGLTSAHRPTAGFLASLRDVSCAGKPLDQCGGDLEISATLLVSESQGAMYRFTVLGDGVVVLSGRAAVVLDAGG